MCLDKCSLCVHISEWSYEVLLEDIYDFCACNTKETTIAFGQKEKMDEFKNSGRNRFRSVAVSASPKAAQIVGTVGYL